MIKTVLITGGNKGIGLELTREFLALEYTTKLPEYINGTTDRYK